MPANWFCDIYCDFVWIAQRNGILGEPLGRLEGAHSKALGISVGINLYGDSSTVRHARVLMGTEEHQIADTCQNMNVQHWVAAIEVAVTLESQRAFHVMRVPDTLMFVTALAQGASDSPATVLKFDAPAPPRLDFTAMIHLVGAWPAELGQHLFYFRRLVDLSLPLDVRWLNGYRLLEWHFVSDQTNLSYSLAWRALLARFDADLEPIRRKGQTNWGLMEQARALAAHAGMDKRSDEERAVKPHTELEATFLTLQHLVMTVLNEHPARQHSKVRFMPPPANTPI